jgi:hypothetical protein
MVAMTDQHLDFPMVMKMAGRMVAMTDQHLDFPMVMKMAGRMVGKSEGDSDKT